MRELGKVEMYRLNYVDIVDRLSLCRVCTRYGIRGNKMIWLEAIRAKALYYIYINTKAVNRDTCL
jgi:hypothetical protein